jgi:hypothetical protein
MEEWTAAVSHGAITQVDDNIITVHTTYLRQCDGDPHAKGSS